MLCSLNIDMTEGGDYGYSTECEVYLSIKDAKDDFLSACKNESIADGTKFVGYIYKHGTKDCTGELPDLMLTIGPRGGVRVSAC